MKKNSFKGIKGNTGDKGQRGEPCKLDGNKAVSQISQFFKKNEEKKSSRKFYLLPSFSSDQKTVLLGDDTVLNKVDPENILPSNSSRHFEFGCKKSELLLSSYSAVEFLSFKVSDFPSQKIIYAYPLGVQALEECGSTCFPHSLETKNLNEYSFAFDYIPSDHQKKLPKNLMLLLTVTYSCSVDNQENNLSDFIEMQKKQMKEFKNSLQKDEKIIQEDKNTFSKYQEVVKEDKELIETLYNELKMRKK